MKFLLALLISVLSGGLMAQNTYYVDQNNGSNSNNGTSPGTAFKTVEEATKNHAQPGDIILIMGTYINNSYDPNYVYNAPHDPHLWHAENTIRISNLHGNPGNYITIKPFDGNTVLKGDGANILRLVDCSYIKIEGLEIAGEVNNIPLSTANSIQFVYIDKDNLIGTVVNPNPEDLIFRDEQCIANCVPNEVADGEEYTNINSLDIARPSYVDTRGLYLSRVHHIDIIDNHIHHLPGVGLRVADGEDINIIGNEVDNNSRRSYSGTHGMVVTKATSTRSGDDYRMKILKNLIHHNYNEQFSWAPDKIVVTPHIDEGKGISLQRNQPANAPWAEGRILVANNIAYYNGFSGVHSNDGDRIDFINNTSYFNSYTQSITEGGGSGGNIGISMSDGTGCKMINNISVIDSDLGKFALSATSGMSGLEVMNNLIYGTTGVITEDTDITAIDNGSTIMSDPLFVDAASFDFHLQASSPAINAAVVAPAPTDDYYGTTRDANPDIGAVEAIVLPVDLISFTVHLEAGLPHLEWITASEVNNDYFSIQRSVDGITWSEIGQKKGHGTTSSTKIYRYQDQSILPTSLIYYRLKQVDYNGSYKYSDIRSIQIEMSQNNNVMMYPIPAFDHILLTGSKVIHSIALYNIEGSRVKSVKNKFESTTYQLAVNDLPSGIYFLLVNDGVPQKVEIIH